MKVFVAIYHDVDNQATARAFSDSVVAVNWAREYMRENSKCRDALREFITGDRWLIMCEKEPANTFVVELEVDAKSEALEALI